MDNELIVLRILHIVPGALWVGAAVITVFIIEPTLTSAGPEVMKQVGPRLAKPLAIFFSSVGILTIVVGLVLVDRAPGHDYGDLFTTGWGWAIGIGLVTSVVAYALGMTGGIAIGKASKRGALDWEEELGRRVRVRLERFGQGQAASGWSTDREELPRTGFMSPSLREFTASYRPGPRSRRRSRTVSS